MPFIVTDSCILCKYTDCVDVCPVDCFYEGENMLAISQTQCIDCGICEPACPVDAIKPDSEPGMEHWVELNQSHSLIWPNIRQRRGPMPEAERYKIVANKFELLSPLPARVSSDSGA